MTAARARSGARKLALLVMSGALTACATEPEVYRGAGLEVASPPASEAVGIYRATFGAAFTLGDPALSLLVDPLLLPRGNGLAGGDSMPRDVLSALLRQGVAKGTCQIPVVATRDPLRCAARRPGYVVRVSAPFALGNGRDSVQVHLVVHQYALPGGPVAERIRFERAYRLVRSGQTWRPTGEARLPRP